MNSHSLIDLDLLIYNYNPVYVGKTTKTREHFLRQFLFTPILFKPVFLRHFTPIFDAYVFTSIVLTPYSYVYFYHNFWTSVFAALFFVSLFSLLFANRPHRLKICITFSNSPTYVVRVTTKKNFNREFFFGRTSYPNLGFLRTKSLTIAPVERLRNSGSNRNGANFFPPFQW